MALSNKFCWLPLATGNKSEYSVGYATLYGDMAGGFALLKDVYKTDVFRLARHLNERAGRELIPQSIIDRAPSAELRDDQLDEDSLPPYPQLDQVLEAYVELDDRTLEELSADGFDKDVVERAVDDRPCRVQAAPGAARREAAAEGVRPRPPDADHEPLARLKEQLAERAKPAQPLGVGDNAAFAGDVEAGRRGASRRAGVPGSRAQAVLRAHPGTPPCPQKPT